MGEVLNERGEVDWISFVPTAGTLLYTRPQAREPLNLAIIRKWPDGFQDRLQHVWLDVVSFIPDVKLYDLQRVLAEYGFEMQVYEAAHGITGEQK